MDKPRQPILNISWNELETAIDSLAYQIKFFKPLLVVGVSRGGLIPACMISHKLNLPMEVVAASSYEGTRRTVQKPLVIEGWEPGYNNDRTIVIDDIMDSGKTYAALLDECASITSPKFRFATLLDKTPRHYPGHSLFYAQVPKDVWVKFPWEQDEI